MTCTNNEPHTTEILPKTSRRLKSNGQNFIIEMNNSTITNDLKVSAKMAVVMGVFLPVGEMVRRINQILDYKEFFSWFDDYILGSVLLWSAYLVFKKTKNSVAYLIGAWGIAAGALSVSFLGQFKYYQTTSGDPGVFPTTFVAVGKGLILLYILVGLKKSIKANTLNS
jgi:hypothetical protein